MGDAIVRLDQVGGTSSNETTTASDGSYNASVVNGTTYDVRFYQRNATVNYPKDGVVDFYPIASNVTAPTSGVDEQLPAGQQLDVQVVNGSGDPIEDATVQVSFERKGIGIGEEALTNASGYLVDPQSDGSGFEVNGSVSIDVLAPSGTDYKDKGIGVTVDSAQTVQITLTKSVNVSGTLTGPDGSPVNNSLVAWDGRDGTEDNVGDITDSQGRFSDELEQNANYGVNFEQWDEADQSGTSFPTDGIVDVWSFGTLQTGTDDIVNNRTLPVGHTLNVTVVNGTGAPIESADVSVTHEQDDAATAVHATTNSNGVMVPANSDGPGFEVNGTVGVYVQPPSDNLSPNGTQVTVDGPRSITLTLRETVNVTGQFVDADGAGIAGEKVNFAVEGASGTTTWTKSDGSFAGKAVEDETVEVHFLQVTQNGSYDEQYEPDNVPDVYAADVIDTAGDRNLNTITLPEAYNVTVEVVDANGNAVSGAEVNYGHINGGAEAYVDAETGTDGQIEFEGTGQFELYVEPPEGSDFGTANAEYTVDDEMMIVFTLPRTATVNGSVEYADGTAASGWSLGVYGVDDTEGGDGTTTASDGSFAADVPQNGTYELEWAQRNFEESAFYPKDGRPDIAVLGEVSVGTNDVDVGPKTLPSANLVNVTVETPDGTAVTSADVTVGTVDRDAGLGSYAPASLDGSGEVVLENAAAPGVEVPDGTLYVRVNPTDGGLASNQTDFDVTGNESLTVVVEPSVNVTGRVLEPDGTPAVGDKIRVNVDGDGGITRNWTDTNGEFSVQTTNNSEIRTGFYQVAGEGSFEPTFPADNVPDLYALGAGPISGDFSLGEKTLPDAYNVTVEVVDANGNAVENAEVNLNSRANSGRIHAQRMTGSEGTIQFESRGPFDIGVEPPAGSTLGRNATQLFIDSERNVTIVLPTSYELTGRWVGPEGQPIADAPATAFNFSLGEFNSDRTDGDGNFAIYTPEGTYVLNVNPQVPNDGIADHAAIDNVTIDGDTDVGNVTAPRGYNVTLNAVDQDGRTVDALINACDFSAYWCYEYADGRDLDNPSGWNNAETREIANGTLEVTVTDSWTKDVLAEQNISVDGTPVVETLEANRYGDTNVSGASGFTVARDLERADDEPVEELLSGTVNVRLWLLNSSSGTSATVTEQLPEGYEFNSTFGVDADGTGSVDNVAYDQGTNTMTFDVTGNVTQVRYRVDPVNDGTQLAAWTGDYDGTDTIGEQYLGTPTLSGQWVGPDGQPIANSRTTAFNFSLEEFNSAETDSNGNFTIYTPEGTYVLNVNPQVPNDGIADHAAIDNVTIDGPTNVDTVSVPRGYNVTLNAVDQNGEAVDAVIGAADYSAYWIYEYADGRDLDNPSGWNNAETREIANGTLEVTVFDSWTGDRLGGKNVTVAGAPLDETLSVDRYNGTTVPDTTDVAVARDLEGTERQSTEELLSGPINVRLFLLNTNGSSSVTVTEQLPAGYALNTTYGEMDNLTFDTDGQGSITNAAYDGSNNTLTFDASGNVTQVRYRVDPVDGGESYAVWSGDFAVDLGSAGYGAPTHGQRAIGKVTVTGTVENTTGALQTRDTVFVKGPEFQVGATDDNGGFELELVPGVYGLGYVQRAEDGSPGPRDGQVDVDKLTTVDATADNDLGSLTAPEGHVVEINVTDESGTPVENASVTIYPDFVSGQDVGYIQWTNADGQYQFENASYTGIELAGEVDIRVRPPESNNFENRTYNRTIQVTGDRTETFTLARDRADVALNVSANQSNIVAGEAVAFTVTRIDTGATVDADLTVDGTTYATGSGGTVSVTFSDPGSFTALASKDRTETERYLNATTNVTVQAPSDLNITDYTVSNTTVDSGEAFDVNVTVENTGDVAGNITLAVTVDGTAATSRDVEVAGDSNETVSLTTSITEPGDHDVTVNTEQPKTVHVRFPANFTLTSVSLPSQAVAGTNYMVNATVENAGELNGTQQVSYQLNGSDVPDALLVSESLTLAPGESQQVSLDVSLANASAGTYTQTLTTANDSNAAALEVLAPANLTTTYTVENASILTTERLNVTATVENTGDVNGSTELVLTKNGSKLASANVTVAGESTETVAFSELLRDAGTYDVTVGSLAPTTVTVERASNPDATVTIDAPTAGGVVGATPTATWSYENVSEGVDHAEYVVDDGSPTTIGLSTTSTELSLADGTHTLTVYLVDNLGNRLSNRQVEFDVDSQAPTVGVTPARTDDVSANRPVGVTVESTDANPATTTFAVENASTGTTVYSTDVTDEVADGTATLSWNAVDDDGNPVASGTYTLVVDSTDVRGQANQTTATVTVDNTEPTVTVTGVGRDAATETSGTVYTNDTIVVSATADGTPGQASSVRTVLDAQSTSYQLQNATTRQSDGTWTTTIDVSAVPDDGRYAVNAIGRDNASNVGTDSSSVTVVVDRVAPTLGATISQKNSTHAWVNVSASETLAAAPNATLTYPGGQTTTVSLTQGDGQYTGTVSLDGDGTYAVDVTATDPTGNLGETTATATILTNVQVENGTATVVSDATGTFVQLTTSQGDSGSASLTVSDTPLANLSADLTGDQFVNGEFGGAFANENLSHAIIGVPVNESALPEGVNKSDVQIRRYNETTEKWEPVGKNGTFIRNLSDSQNGISGEYYLANVSHFSKYGSIAADTTAPTLASSSLSPSGGPYAFGTDSVLATFDYEDDLSGIDPAAVEVYFDETEVTTNTGAQITSDVASYNATSLNSGDHNVTVVAVDAAGNEQAFTETFTVEADTTAPTVETTGGGTYAYGTDSVTVRFNYSDTQSGVNTSAVSLTFDNGTRTDVTAPATITSEYAAFTADGLTSGAYNLTATVVDEVDNSQTETVTFSVGEDETAPSVTATTPTNGTTVQAGTEEVTVTVSYSDDASGVDPSATTAAFNGNDVTDDAVVTDAKTEYIASGLTNGSDYAFTVDVVDAAGNVQTETVAFSVAEPSTDDTTGDDTTGDDTTGDDTTGDDTTGDDTTGDDTTGDDTTGGSTAPASGGSSAGSTGSANVSVVTAAVDATELSAGESVTATATVENTGNATGRIEVRLVVDGTDTGESRIVDVPAGERRTVTLVQRFDAAGEYTVTLGGVSAGTVTVTEGTSPTSTPDASSDDDSSETPTTTATPESVPGDGTDETPTDTPTATGTPTGGDGVGFTAGLGLVALLVAGLLAQRRD